MKRKTGDKQVPGVIGTAIEVKLRTAMSSIMLGRAIKGTMSSTTVEMNPEFQINTIVAQIRLIVLVRHEFQL